MNSTKTISTLMTPSPQTVNAEETLRAAREMMETHQIRHLPVVQGVHVIGVISDHHLRLAKTFEAHLPGNLTIADVCALEPYSVSPQAPAHEVLSKMAQSGTNCAVIIEHGELAGIFTAVDACREFGVLLNSAQN